MSPLTNLLLAPMLPGLMGLGALAVALGAVAEPLGQAVSPVAGLYLTYMVEVIRWTAQLPAASVPTGSLGLEAALLFWSLLLGVALWPLPEMRGVRDAVASVVARSPRWAVAALLVALFSLGALSLSTRPNGRVHVFFLDVGQGDATLIRGPEGHTILVDGGPSPTALSSALGRRLGFLDRGLDAVVVTDYGEGRLAGLVEVARRHPVGLVLQPGLPQAKGLEQAWKEVVRERGPRTERAAAGQRIPLGADAWLEVVWAPAGGAEQQERALALKLAAEGASVLLMGDLSRATQAELASRSAGSLGVLRVPRQGGAGALDEQLLQRTAPRIAVVSVRSGNRAGYPAESTLGQLRGAALFRTDRDGTVEVVLGRDGYEVFTER